MSAQLPKIVIIGAGFAGLACALGLKRAKADITLVDRENHHLFQPLLYQVATAALSPAQIAAPTRLVLSKQWNTKVVLDSVLGVDRASRTVILENGDPLPFDYLVIATGARHSYFGKDEWSALAPGIKNIDDATRVRRNILLAFEEAEAEPDDARRAALLTFAVIGGGPTGVEMAGSIAEVARHSIKCDFRRINPREAKVVLIEAGERLLVTMPPELSASAKKSLECMGVEVRLNTRVDTITEDGVSAGGMFMPCATKIWAAGVQASPAAQWLGVTPDRQGRVPVEADLTLSGEPNIYVLGDTAAFTPVGAERPLPGIAPVAKQAGQHTARALIARIEGQSPPAFQYRHYGNLATIGRKAAVADFGKIRLKGAMAWFVWGIAHVYFLVGYRNRFAVLVDWMWSYITYQRGVRLITGGPRKHKKPQAAPQMQEELA